MSDVQVYDGRVDNYPMEKVLEALTVLVRHRGNLAKASEECRIDRNTLRRWAQDRYPERYMEIEENFGRELEQILVMEARETARVAGIAERKAVEKVLEEIEQGVPDTCPRCKGSKSEVVDGKRLSACLTCDGTGTITVRMKGRELAQAAYALSKIKGTNVDKVLALTGRPTSPQGNGSVSEALGLVRELQGLGAIQVVNQAETPAIPADVEET
jgi:hypothetical protein